LESSAITGGVRANSPHNLVDPLREKGRCAPIRGKAGEGRARTVGVHDNEALAADYPSDRRSGNRERERVARDVKSFRGDANAEILMNRRGLWSSQGVNAT
jgi:hypothetical protein